VKKLGEGWTKSEGAEPPPGPGLEPPLIMLPRSTCQSGLMEVDIKMYLKWTGHILDLTSDNQAANQTFE